MVYFERFLESVNKMSKLQVVLLMLLEKLTLLQVKYRAREHQMSRELCTDLKDKHDVGCSDKFLRVRSQRIEITIQL